ncbi:MAG: helix-turn-helix domain-containing protein [Rickettsiales bacterium]|nr:helix-turn-helix domain-containing protein [Rickettsiales bacterium]
MTGREVIEVDSIIGRNIERRRRQLSMTQQAVGKKLGVTHQQIYRYETGQSRIPSDKIYLLAQALRMPVSDLFAGLEHTGPKGVSRTSCDTEHLTQSLLHSYSSIKDRSLQSCLVQLTGMIARM